MTNYANALVGQEEIIRNYEESLGLDREGTVSYTHLGHASGRPLLLIIEGHCR